MGILVTEDDRDIAAIWDLAHEGIGRTDARVGQENDLRDRYPPFRKVAFHPDGFHPAP